MTTAAGPESWGRYPRVQQDWVVLRDRGALLPPVPGPALPYGNGRSYGDSCAVPGGTLLVARGLDRFMAFDPETGRIRCEAGVLLSEIIDFAVPKGWFVPVTPGTKFVTLGGAVANDIHGKNHHSAGSFGNHVLAFELLRSDGARCVITPGNSMFGATIGGLGLTGTITWVEIRLRRIAGPWLATETRQFATLAEFFDLSNTLDDHHEYTVSWIDCVARRGAIGRGIFMTGDHVTGTPDHRPRAPRRRLDVPFVPPVSMVNRITLRPLNALYYHRRRGTIRSIQHYEPFFYPLDGIGHWNRLYGPKGLLQYQCVVPPADAQRSLEEILKRIAASETGSPLAVLKRFGKRPAPGLMSFPKAGVTLALDFPRDVPEIFTLLSELDRIVAEAGGAVYPAKDARMSANDFRRFFPNWETFMTFKDPLMISGLWRRVSG